MTETATRTIGDCMRSHKCDGNRCWLQGSGWPQDFECVNGVAIDIDEFTEGCDTDEIRPLAPCHPGFCKACFGGIFDNDDCPDCKGTGNTLGENDADVRLEAAYADAQPDIDDGDDDLDDESRPGPQGDKTNG